MSKRPQIRTTHTEIVYYWTRRETECGLSVDWVDAHKRCWRCSRRGRLQKCHIVPHALGGADTPENFVLLCLRCHREAPDVSDPSFMWIWLRKYAVTLYDTDWIIRGFAEYERIFGHKPFEVVSRDIPETELMNALKKHRKKAIIHFGEGRLNPSTVAWLLSQIEKDLIGQNSRAK